MAKRLGSRLRGDERRVINGPLHRRPPPWRRLRAAFRRRRGGAGNSCRRRQCARSHGGDGGDHRGRLSAHESPWRRRRLAGARGVGRRPGLDDFYRGDVAREIAADLERVGSPVTRADLERCRATEAAPLSVALSAGTLWNTPPPTPGLVALMILALHDRLGVKEAESFDHLHGLIEASKRATVVRDRVITDPARLPHPLDRYLGDAFLDAEAAAIDRRKAGAWKAKEEVGDT